MFPCLSIETTTLERLASKNPRICPSHVAGKRTTLSIAVQTETEDSARRALTACNSPFTTKFTTRSWLPTAVFSFLSTHFKGFGSKHKNTNPGPQPTQGILQKPSPRGKRGGTTGRPARAGQASQRRRAQRWSRRFGGLPVRGTVPHCATPRSAGQLLASPTTPGSRARPHPTGRTRWAGHVWSLSCIGPARGGPAVVCVLRSSSAVQTRVLRSPGATCSARCAGVL